MKALFIFLTMIGIVIMTPSYSYGQEKSSSSENEYAHGTKGLSGMDLGSGRLHLSSTGLGSGRLNLSGTDLGSGRLKNEPVFMGPYLEDRWNIGIGEIILSDGIFHLHNKEKWIRQK